MNVYQNVEHRVSIADLLSDWEYFPLCEQRESLLHMLRRGPVDRFQKLCEQPWVFRAKIPIQPNQQFLFNRQPARNRFKIEVCM